MKITEKMKIKEKGIFWCLFGIFLTGALPLFTNYCLNSSEIPYQLVRQGCRVLCIHAVSDE